MATSDIGVPGAVAEALRRLAGRVAPERLDRIWIFPPLTSGRAESGVIVAGCFGADDRRTLVTLAYRAEETGRGITFVETFQEQGEAPPDRLPRVVEGVVERSESGLQGPHSARIGGDPGRFEALLQQWRSGEDGEGRFGPAPRSSGPGAVESKEEAPA